jgi:hypothetical protein
LLQSMPARCRAIIEADGGPIRFWIASYSLYKSISSSKGSTPPPAEYCLLNPTKSLGWPTGKITAVDRCIYILTTKTYSQQLLPKYLGTDWK